MPSDNPNEPIAEPDDNTPAGLRAALDRSRTRAQELETQLASTAALQREVAMLKAGIDLESPTGKLFVRAYDGPLDDIEKVKEAWAEVSPAVPPIQGEPAGEAPPSNDGATPEELEQQRRRAAVRGDAVPPGAEPSPDPWDQAYAVFHEEQRKGRRRADAGAAALTGVIQAALAGDERVLYNRDRWMATFE